MIAIATLAAASAALPLAAFSWRYAWWRPAIDYRLPRILMYHMIREPLPGGRFNKLRVAPAAFERQLRHLAENGWRFAFVSELARLGDAGKTVALTFDDGFRDNYLAAHPLLARYGAKATLFLVADRFGRDWSDAKRDWARPRRRWPRGRNRRRGELLHEDKLRDEEVRAMLDSGLWELGGHTLTHPPLPALPAAERRREIAGGKAHLEERFGAPVRAFAYPFGLFDETDAAVAEASGYDCAVTTEAGISADPEAEAFTLRRVKISGKDGMFAFQLRLRGGRRGARE